MDQANRFHSRTQPRRLTVTTPEQVELRFETAGVGSRVGAQLIDVSILAVVNGAIFLGAFFLLDAMTEAWRDRLQEYAFAIMILLFAATNGGYFLVGEYVGNGRTIGKRAMSIRVIQENGRPLSFLSSAIRNALRLVDALPALYFVGAAFSFFHPQDKRLGDMAAGTVVVHEPGSARRRAKRMEKRLASWRPAFPALELDAGARERVTEEEWSLVAMFAERLPDLAPRRAEELARDIVWQLAPKLGLAERWREALDAEEQARSAVRGVPQSVPPSASQSAPLNGPPGEPPDAAPSAPPSASQSAPPSAPQSASQSAPPSVPRPAPLRRPVSVAWALALYDELRADWELFATGGEA